MKRIPTLNEDKGKEISDLEALIIVMGKLLSDKIKDKPKAGITLAKGKPNERRFRYIDAKEALRYLEIYLGTKGCFSIGICHTCTKFDTNKPSDEGFGTCSLTGKLCTKWDTCSNHSTRGGGYGV